MTDVLIDSLGQRAPDLIDVSSGRDAEEDLETSSDGVVVSTFGPLDEHLGGGSVSTELVEDLPMSLVEAYTDIAVRHCSVREVDGGGWFATVVGIEGAWGDGDTPEDAVAELREAIVGWVAVKRRVGATDIPPMEGLDLNLPS